MKTDANTKNEAKPKRNRSGKAVGEDGDYNNINRETDNSAGHQIATRHKDGVRTKRTLPGVDVGRHATAELGDQLFQMRHELAQQGARQARQGEMLEELLRRSGGGFDRDVVHSLEARDLEDIMKIEVIKGSPEGLNPVEFATREDESVEDPDPEGKYEHEYEYDEVDAGEGKRVEAGGAAGEEVAEEGEGHE